MRDKLKSRRGASVVLALLVLLVCVTAGAAALTAAGANAGRYTHLRADQQRYLAVSSAAKLIRDELCGTQMTASIEAYESRDPDTLEMALETDPSTGELLYTYSCSCTPTAFADWLSQDLDELEITPALLETDALPTPSAHYTGLGFDILEGDGEPLEQVRWSFDVESDYRLVVHLWLEEDGEKYYPMVLTIPAQGGDCWTGTTERDPSVLRERWKVTRSATVTWPASGAVITQS